MSFTFLIFNWQQDIAAGGLFLYEQLNEVCFKYNWRSNITPFGQTKMIQTSSIASSKIGYSIVNDRKQSFVDMVVLDPTKVVTFDGSGGLLMCLILKVVL